MDGEKLKTLTEEQITGLKVEYFIKGAASSILLFVGLMFSVIWLRGP